MDKLSCQSTLCYGEIASSEQRMYAMIVGSFFLDKQTVICAGKIANRMTVAIKFWMTKKSVFSAGCLTSGQIKKL